MIRGDFDKRLRLQDSPLDKSGPDGGAVGPAKKILVGRQDGISAVSKVRGIRHKEVAFQHQFICFVAPDRLEDIPEARGPDFTVGMDFVFHAVRIVLCRVRSAHDVGVCGAVPFREFGRAEAVGHALGVEGAARPVVAKPFAHGAGFIAIAVVVCDKIAAVRGVVLDGMPVFVEDNVRIFRVVHPAIPERHMTSADGFPIVIGIINTVGAMGVNGLYPVVDVQEAEGLDIFLAAGDMEVAHHLFERVGIAVVAEFSAGCCWRSV